MKNGNGNKANPTFEISFCALLLESARRYSVLADAIFNFSVEQSNFANKISGQRMALATVVVQKQMDFVITFEGEVLEIYQSTVQVDMPLELWKNCLALDEIIQEVLEYEDDSWKPVIQGLQNIVQKGEEFSKEIAGGRGEAEAWQCLNCGAVIPQQSGIDHCPTCGVNKNWFYKI